MAIASIPCPDTNICPPWSVVKQNCSGAMGKGNVTSCLAVSASRIVTFRADLLPIRICLPSGRKRITPGSAPIPVSFRNCARGKIHNRHRFPLRQAHSSLFSIFGNIKSGSFRRQLHLGVDAPCFQIQGKKSLRVLRQNPQCSHRPGIVPWCGHEYRLWRGG